MSLALIESTATNSDWWRSDSFAPWVETLRFPINTWGILTPFLEKILNDIYRTALGLSEGLLESAIVEAVSEPDEEDSLHLHLALTINMDWDELDSLHDQILARVVKWSDYWPEEDQEDYGRWIFFSLTPSSV